MNTEKKMYYRKQGMCKSAKIKEILKSNGEPISQTLVQKTLIKSRILSG